MQGRSLKLIRRIARVRYKWMFVMEINQKWKVVVLIQS